MQPVKMGPLKSGASSTMSLLSKFSFWALYGHHAQSCSAAAAITAEIHLVLSLRSMQRKQLLCLRMFRPPESGAWSGLVPLQIPAAAVRWYGLDLVRIILS